MKYLELSGYLSGRAIKEVSKAELLQRTSATPAVFNGLVDRGVFEVYQQEIGRIDKALLKEVIPVNPLNEHQQRAYHSILENFQQERLPATWCHGKRQDRSLYSSDRRNHPARKAGALSPARNSSLHKSQSACNAYSAPDWASITPSSPMPNGWKSGRSSCRKQTMTLFSASAPPFSFLSATSVL